MRIIAGTHGGRNFVAPQGHKTHPMSEKMRGAIFNSLGDINGLSLLDAYSGSGAIAYEAVSRGATRVIVIECDKKACEVIKENTKNLGMDIKITRANISSWLDNNQKLQFDIIVCDPPYDNVKQLHLQKLAKVLKPYGIVVYSLPPKILPSLNKNYKLLNLKDYGDSTLVFYRRIG